MLIVVVLPAPLGPRKPNTSPVATSKSTPRTACTSPNVLTRLLTVIADVGSAPLFRLAVTGLIGRLRLLCEQPVEAPPRLGEQRTCCRDLLPITFTGDLPCGGCSG